MSKTTDWNAVAEAAEAERKGLKERNDDEARQRRAQLTTEIWEARGKAGLLGRRIVDVRYMTPAEAEDHDWDGRAIVLTLDDGSHIYPSGDDEGNGPGALWSDNEKHNGGWPTL